MPLTTSSQFASVIETGTDWRDTSKKILEQLESIRTQDRQFNIGILYVSDHLSEDVSSIVNLFKSVLEIDHWVGSVGMGICGNGVAELDNVSISVMIGQFEEDSFHFLPQNKDDSEHSGKNFENWLDRHEPMLTLTHINPDIKDNPVNILETMDQDIGGFVVGGLASSRSEYAVIGASDDNEINSIVFSSETPVATTLSQGCQKISPPRTITRCQNNKIFEIDDKPALEVFETDLSLLAEHNFKKSDEELEKTTGERDLITGDIHAAIPISGSDQGHYLVRHITDIDETTQSLEIAYAVEEGGQIIFVNRNEETMRADLSKQLLNLRERIQKDHGTFSPKGGIYISCVARAMGNFSDQEDNTEMALVKDIIGDIPLTGFYASGEINGAKLYGYTGILILFL